jgi:hypothetical protein
MKPNEEIIGTLGVALLVFGTQDRAKCSSAEELTHRAIEAALALPLFITARFSNQCPRSVGPKKMKQNLGDQ